MNGEYIVKTKNSIYDIDFDRHVISGGKLCGYAGFAAAILNADGRLVCDLANGQTLITSTVVQLIQVSTAGNVSKRVALSLSQL